jgi:hypothetical protein
MRKIEEKRRKCVDMDGDYFEGVKMLVDIEEIDSSSIQM